MNGIPNKDLTAESQRTRREIFYSFAAETPANEVIHFSKKAAEMYTFPKGLGLFLFRPSQRKEIRKNSLRSLCL